MLATLIIIFREVIEAGLIVGIVLAATKGVPGRSLWVALGVLGGLIGAAILAVFAGGLRVLALPCDVGKEDEVRWAIDAAAERFGRLDILINNAGVIQVGPLDHMTLEDFEEALRVHFWGPLYATTAALPHLRRQETARIVNIASIGGRIAVPHLAPYSASKFALVGLSDGLRAELANLPQWTR